MPEAALADVQGDSDPRGITIERAGVAGLAMPLAFLEADGTRIDTQAEASAWAEVPPSQRGAHMSRLVTALSGWRSGVSLEGLAGLLDGLAGDMEAGRVGARLDFPFFVERETPVSGLGSWVDCRARVEGTRGGGKAEVEASVEVPATTLCPCSKEVSETGAHSQRSLLRATVAVGGSPPVLREMAARLESHASARIDAVLKRADEKFVTEGAYSRPRFAEDVARDIAADLAADPGLGSWRVSVRNMESIHNHDVFAVTSSAQA